jgi:hypothetical protein
MTSWPKHSISKTEQAQPVNKRPAVSWQGVLPPGADFLLAPHIAAETPYFCNDAFTAGEKYGKMARIMNLIAVGGKPMLIPLILWACCGLVCSILAYRHDRNIKIWFTIGMIGGIISVIVLVLLCLGEMDYSNAFKIVILVLCFLAFLYFLDSVLHLFMSFSGGFRIT